jgi:DNA-directed RNA polymerase
MERRIRKRNAELNSLRCDTEIKLKIAEEFKDHEFYFPYNLDFRGRSVSGLRSSNTALALTPFKGCGRG